MQDRPEPFPPKAAAALLVLGTLALYARTVAFDFVNLDDPNCVTQVPMITRGLTLEGIAWAFTDGLTDAHWKPLSVLSHMFDCTLFGLKPGGHHAMNAIWHAAAAVLLFAALRRMTGATGRSWIVAALFAWHPTHVESVAWITERKDTLCAFFWMLSLWTYARYAEAPSARRYVAVVAAVAAALVAKSMAVTLPFVLLLLDFWPLRRVTIPVFGLVEDGTSRMQVSLRRALLEKVPLLALAAGASWMAMHAIRSLDGLGAHDGIDTGLRISNALVSYGRYVVMTFWPADLAVFYPFPKFIPGWQVWTSGLALAGVVTAACLRARSCPWLIVGSLWFTGVLVPVIGFVQASWASHGDRYTYLPHIGLFIALVWTGHAVVAGWRAAFIGPAVAGASLAACLAASWFQIGHWSDSFSLYRRALSVTKDNWLAQSNLGLAFSDAGRFDEAERHMRESLRLRPGNPTAHLAMGAILSHQGRHAEARGFYATVMRDPRLGAGNPALLTGFRQAAEAHPSESETHYNLANALLALGRTSEAIEPLRRVLALRPRYAAAHVDLGAILAAQGEGKEAAVHYRAALLAEPANAVAHANLGGLLSDLNQLDDALVHLAEAHRLQAGNIATRYNFALALAKRGRHAEATTHLLEILRHQPNNANALNRLAWLLATSSDNSVRNAAEALILAEKLQQNTGRKQAMGFDTEAAALAECGRFEDAVTAARQALDLARTSGAGPLAESIAQRLKLYEARRPHRETADRSTP